MAWILSASLGAGILLGLRIRFPLFLMFLVVISGFVAGFDLVYERKGMLFELIIMNLGMQIGYVGGLVLRAGWSYLHECTEVSARSEEPRYPWRCER